MVWCPSCKSMIMPGKEECPNSKCDTNLEKLLAHIVKQPRNARSLMQRSGFTLKYVNEALEILVRKGKLKVIETNKEEYYALPDFDENNFTVQTNHKPLHGPKTRKKILDYIISHRYENARNGIYEGITNQEIGAAVGIHPRTVEDVTRELEKAGIIKSSDPNYKGVGKSKHYYPVLEKIGKPADSGN